MPILPRRFHALVRQALSGHLTEMQGVPDLNKHVIAWTVSYVLGDRAHVIERLDTVYRHLNPGALPYQGEMDLPSFDPHAVRRPTAAPKEATKEERSAKFPSKDFPAGKGGKAPPKGVPGKKKKKARGLPPPPKPDFQQRILF